MPNSVVSCFTEATSTSVRGTKDQRSNERALASTEAPRSEPLAAKP